MPFGSKRLPAPKSTLVSARLTGKIICDHEMDYAISIYLRQDEIKEAMLEKFGNDKIKLVQFLREREFENL